MLLAVLLILPALPVALLVFAWKAWPADWTLSPARRRYALAALVCASFSALLMPFLIFGRFLRPPPTGTGISVTLTVTIGIAFASSLAGLLLAICASGRVRWLTVIASLLCLATASIAAAALPL
jgi:hypothetical protein